MRFFFPEPLDESADQVMVATVSVEAEQIEESISE
jgi:hypothetical protein